MLSYPPKYRTAYSVRYSDTATMTEGSGDNAVTHNFFQENKEGWIFETRTELTVVGSVWSKGTITFTTGE